MFLTLVHTNLNLSSFLDTGLTNLVVIVLQSIKELIGGFGYKY